MSAPSDGAAPLPPPELAARIGCAGVENMMEVFDDLGRAIKNEVVGCLPGGWTFEDRRVLDFGCGCGRLLRHFIPEESAVAEIHGADIDAEAIEWVQQNLCPPLAGAAATGYRPPLPYPDSHFDLVIATSVFTHITDEWSDWLLEMQRILKPDGLLLATFLGPPTSMPLIGEALTDDQVGMNPLGFWAEPYVFHSEWWLRAHWGRLFEFLEFHPSGFAQENREVGHGFVLLRPRPVSLTNADLERDEPGEPRYVSARRHHLGQLAREGAKVAALLGRQETPYTKPHGSKQAASG